MYEIIFNITFTIDVGALQGNFHTAFQVDL